MEPTRPGKARHTCGATNRQGKPCGKPAGWGTPSTTGRCKLHGGNTPNGKKHAQTLEAQTAVATYGLPREIDPHSALLEELHRTAGHVAWLGMKVRELEERDTYGPVGGGEWSTPEQKPHVYIVMYQGERKHFAQIAKTCVDVGIEERRVLVAEQQGLLMAQVVEKILTDLGVRDRPEVPNVVRRAFTLLEGGAAAA